MTDKVLMLVPEGISQSTTPSHQCVKFPHKMLNCLIFQLLHPVLAIRRSHQQQPRSWSRNFQVSFHSSCILRLSTHCEDCCLLTSRSCTLVLGKTRMSLPLIHSVRTGSVHHIQIKGEFGLLHTSHSTGAYCSYVPTPAVFPIFRVKRNSVHSC